MWVRYQWKFPHCISLIKRRLSETSGNFRPSRAYKMIVNIETTKVLGSNTFRVLR